MSKHRLRFFSPLETQSRTLHKGDIELLRGSSNPTCCQKTTSNRDRVFISLWTDQAVSNRQTASTANLEI